MLPGRPWWDEHVRQLLPYPAEDLTDDDLLAAYAPVQEEHLRVNFVSSADGAVTLSGKSGGLSGPADKRLFQLLRDMADVVLVAAGTIRNEGYGFPEFSAARRERRRKAGRAELPTFAIVSRSLDLDLSSSLFTDAPVRTIVLTDGTAPPDRRTALAEHAEVVVTDGLPGHVRALRERGHGAILCEGGPSLFAGLTAAGLLDELCLTISPLLAGPGPGRIVAGPEHAPVPLTLTTLLEEDGALFHRFAVRKGD
jgi:riboflavin biosynthesis pyrimidine reductase